MNLEKAIYCYKKALSYFYKLGTTIHANLLIIYQCLYEIYHILGEWNESVKYLTLLNDILQDENYTAPDKQARIKSNNNTIKIYKGPRKRWRNKSNKSQQQRRKHFMKTNQSHYIQWFRMIDNQTRVEFVKYFDCDNYTCNNNQCLSSIDNTTNEINYNTLQIINNISQFKECHNKKCLRKDVNFKKCKQCQCVFYCCRKCQKIDWKAKNGHRLSCKLLKDKGAKRALSDNMHPSPDLFQLPVFS